jgi:hypothetical protein
VQTASTSTGTRATRLILIRAVVVA